MRVPFAMRCALSAALLLGSHPAAAADAPVMVFAAASLKTALDEVNTAFAAQGGSRVTASYAATSALMKQIEQGAPADVFISADLDWMEYGLERRLVRGDTRIDLLGNDLVLIAPADAAVGPAAITPGLDVVALAANGRIVTADVRAVPAGRYAKAALEKLGLWQAVEPRLAMAENVRVALALVARGEAGLGIVYATDARAEPRVKVIGTFPPGSHPAVVYPAALTAGAGPPAAAYLAFLRGTAAGTIFERHGFAFLPGR